MNIMKEISEKEFLQKLKDGVSKKVVWQKPFLLLCKDGSDYNYISDAINETYNSYCINTDPLHFKFVRNDNKLEMSLNGEIVDGHHPDVDIYEYLGGPLGYDEKIHRYCVDLVEYEGKPVISFICVTDKNCSIENIPDWMYDKFDIGMIRLDFSSYSGK